MIDLATLTEGRISQIDYDDQRRITKLHVDGADGGRYEIRFAYPAVLPDLNPGQRQYAIFNPDNRPEVSVVRIA